MSPFRDRLEAIVAGRGALCVGLDPSPAAVRAWGLEPDAAGIERLARGLIAAVGDLVAVFKPQAAFYEPYGAAGIAVLERVLADIAQTGALSILDVKRGDIGSTMSGYARAYLSPGAPLAADAITLSPYLGFDSLTPAFDLAEAHDRGVYVLCRTSNPEGPQVQTATTAAATSVAQAMVDGAAARNTASGVGAIGLVIGGTLERLDLDLGRFTGSILVPGIGAQGGSVGALGTLFGAAASQVLPSASREVMSAGPDVAALREATSRLVQTFPAAG